MVAKTMKGYSCLVSFSKEIMNISLNNTTLSNSIVSNDKNFVQIFLFFHCADWVNELQSPKNNDLVIEIY